MVELLVVDDDKDICWALDQGLLDEGVRVTQVQRGEDALREVKGRSFDAAIIDVKLPGESGIEVSQVIRQFAPRLPIVMISGYHYEGDPSIQEGIRRGEYQGFISKPFELDEVWGLLRRIIRASPESSSLEPVFGPEGQTERR